MSFPSLGPLLHKPVALFCVTRNTRKNLGFTAERVFNSFGDAADVTQKRPLDAIGLLC